MAAVCPKCGATTSRSTREADGITGRSALCPPRPRDPPAKADSARPHHTIPRPRRTLPDPATRSTGQSALCPPRPAADLRSTGRFLAGHSLRGRFPFGRFPFSNGGFALLGLPAILILAPPPIAGHRQPVLIDAAFVQQMPAQRPHRAGLAMH